MTITYIISIGIVTVLWFYYMHKQLTNKFDGLKHALLGNCIMLFSTYDNTLQNLQNSINRLEKELVKVNTTQKHTTNNDIIDD